MRRRFGRALPRLRTPVPGPRSRALAERQAAVEVRSIAPGEASPPVFWRAARGANVRDVDGNTYIDLTGGFGVAAAGHSSPRVTRAVARQVGRLAHALGDVHPAAVKVELLERLGQLAPGDLCVSLLASAGAEAVEVALKTAFLATGRPGVVAFQGSYHGLTYGALSVTGRTEFRAPFQPLLGGQVRFAPYPAEVGGAAVSALDSVRAELATGDVGAVIVEPVLGRGGMVVPPVDFLPGLRALCDEHGAVLIFDEIYTGFGRTGRWFACEHAGVVPDIMTVGKSLTGMLPLSAAIGTAAVMDAWPPWSGEAPHTSTFLGNPVSCAAALAHLRAIGRGGLVERADVLGRRVGMRLEAWARRLDGPGAGARGLG
ncbi:MAG: aspartate aminotransferase family protein, partial [Longimicrobiales bacterium]